MVDPRRPYAGLEFAPGTKFPDYITVQGNSVPVGFINYLPHSAQSNYHALLARFEKRLSSGSIILSAYTWSKAIANAPSSQDSFDLRADRGLASFHTAHRWVTTAVYELPFGPGKSYLQEGLASKILSGIQLSGIYSMQSGFPFTINLQGDTAGVGAGTGGIFVRPNYVSGQTVALDNPNTERFFNTSAFSIPAAATFGNVGKNTVIGPGLVNLDLALSKDVRFTERFKFQFRAESFNIANHPNWTVVGRIANNQPTFGKGLGQLDPRQLQFGGKLIF